VLYVSPLKALNNDVFVAPGGPSAAEAPFWRAEPMSRDFHFSERIGLFLEEANHSLDDPGFPDKLRREHCMDETAAALLLDFLRRQKERTRCDLPHRHHLVVEHVETGPGGVPGGRQLIIHTVWGGRVNRPYAIALQAAWQERFGERIEVFAADDCIYLVLPRDVAAANLLAMVASTTVESQLRKRLESSGFFGARFRECAARALLLTRRSINQRLPLWLSRLRSQQLLESVLDREDFPILLEAWRTCLRDEFDLHGLQKLLVELESGVISWSETRRLAPSPFAQTMTWGQINAYMYRDDTPTGDTRSRLREDLLREAVFTPELRPAVARDLIDRFEAKRRRTAPGYSPQSSRDLLDWVKERSAIPLPEWNELLDAMERDHGDEAKAELWETDFLPARVQPYDTAWLDAAMQQADLLWVGGARQRARFCFESDMPLIREEPGEDSAAEELPAEVAALFPDPAGRYDFAALLARADRAPAVLAGQLWNAVWRGLLTNDAFAALRRGIETGFKAPDVAAGARGRRRPSRRLTSRRPSFSRWKNSLPFAGNWRLLPQTPPEDDPIAGEERGKERVRLLLDR